ncbi:raffinose/stachyose/melibiose transport system substrate-binding protein [Streptosporangium becharense]|uniref:Raffinose/stachyose/melibiose transport system substrate-binding protein n=1 Tax=Streptosporangium becharense TaxID=1816182 RepID=A0A7W9MHJ8_9ACTN|nr:ABC transporter substrate-binding protein [Streptosporangium becharense]MBB2912628.1 raffinose/stachyose/melibiose transport system substrate-binding protein [Streptosporangium becharense]MBB5820543.1 raffinose/stachyose/melibiose transport system substrate-binding protein [Streptosporangium becharense]
MRGTARALATAAAALTLGLVAACSGGSGSAGEPPVDQARTPQDRKTVTLKYWTSFPAEATLTETLAEFERTNPGIEIELDVLDGDELRKRLPEALEDGEEIDVVGLPIQEMTDTVKDRLRPVSEWESALPDGWRSRLDERVIEQAGKAAGDGKLYSVPMGSAGGAIMYANASLLSELGEDFPETAADLESIVTRVKKELPDVRPVVFSGEPRRLEEILFTVSGQSDPSLAADVLAGRRPWNAPDLVAALTAYGSLFERGVLDKSALNLKGDRPAELFGQGKALFLVDDSAQARLLSASYRRTEGIAVGDVAAGAFPVVLPGGKPVARGLAGTGLAVPKSSKHTKEAARLVEFLALGDGVPEWAADMTLIPALKDFEMDSAVLVGEPAKEGYAKIRELVGTGGPAYHSPEAFLSRVEGEVIGDLVRGRITPKNAASKLDKEWAGGRYDGK